MTDELRLEPWIVEFVVHLLVFGPVGQIMVMQSAIGYGGKLGSESILAGRDVGQWTSLFPGRAVTLPERFGQKTYWRRMKLTAVLLRIE